MIFASGSLISILQLLCFLMISTKRTHRWKELDSKNCEVEVVNSLLDILKTVPGCMIRTRDTVSYSERMMLMVVEQGKVLFYRTCPRPGSLLLFIITPTQ